MRKIVALTFVSIDGVMQAPGGPEEDESGGFSHGGWTVPYFDEFLGGVMGEQMGRPFDLLLGRRTFEVFASYWPDHEEEGAEINAATKYVVSNTVTEHAWQPTRFLAGDVASEIRELKVQEGPDLHVHGSATLLQALFENDLVDEVWLKLFPVTLGAGKRLFGSGSIPARFELLEAEISPAGVIVASYRRAGAIETGSF